MKEFSVVIAEIQTFLESVFDTIVNEEERWNITTKWNKNEKWQL